MMKPQPQSRPGTGVIISGHEFTMTQYEELSAEAVRRGITRWALVNEMFPDRKAPIPDGPLFPKPAA